MNHLLRSKEKEGSCRQHYHHYHHHTQQQQHSNSNNNKGKMVAKVKIEEITDKDNIKDEDFPEDN